MLRSTIRMAGDYNRGLCPEFRCVHVLLACVRGMLSPFTTWMLHPVRRSWATPLCISILGFALLYPLDGPLSRALRELPIKGDIRRELTAWQQYGALTSLLVVAVVIVLLDQGRWRRVLDLTAAAVLGILACNFLKNFVGRPRPILNDPETFLWPWGEYPVPVAAGSSLQSTGQPRFVLTHAWSGPRSVGYELWSMPSSHTAMAVVLSVFLGVMYPKLRLLVIVLAALVGITRVITGAHWPTDVLIGATLGYTVASAAVNGHWGMRALDWVWIRCVDRDAHPSFTKRDTTL
ncbi:MAG: phosphatase PAP2 family protein [Pyrinomonadaceae bacterium]|nr:phosphatase PAP2 family protein [Phycisphaerales bacterium]